VQADSLRYLVTIPQWHPPAAAEVCPTTAHLVTVIVMERFSRRSTDQNQNQSQFPSADPFRETEFHHNSSQFITFQH
jgi:hypothetical protein